MGEVRTSGRVGRNHHIEAYTMFMAGAGIRAGQTVGGSDDFGYTATEKFTCTIFRRRSCTSWAWITPSSLTISRGAIFD